VPYRDPASAILADPQVPESRRFCAGCEQPVGRGQDGRAGSGRGFLPQLRHRVSFSPKLEPGDLVAGQYEVLGCSPSAARLDLPGQGPQRQRPLGVVLKGLLNTGDADAMAAAVAERQFLAQVEHPNIVRIYNFVQHADRRTGESAGYIVMEYVGGKSLKQILQDARRDGGSVPLAHAIAYAVEVLPALGYLHDRGLVYCDFKPDNVIQTEEQLKLIDMGGVRASTAKDRSTARSAIRRPRSGRTGRRCPRTCSRWAGRWPCSPSSSGATRATTSSPSPTPCRCWSSRSRSPGLLRRATHRDPERRFGSAGEMAEQLTGVLREVLATADGVPRSAFSTVFSPELQAIGTGDGRAEDQRPRWPSPGRPDHRGDADDRRGPGRPAAGLSGHVRRARLRPSERPRCPAQCRATRPCRPRSPAPPRRGWRWRAPSSTSATTTEPELRWPTWPPRTRPTGGSPGPTACAG